MLQEQSRFFQRLLFFADVILIACSWVLSYWIRFEYLLPPEWRPITSYAVILPWVLIVSSLVFWLSGLYAADRAQRLSRMILAVFKAMALGLLVLTASLSFYRTFSFSRLHMIFFAILAPASMLVFRLVLYTYVRRARAQGRHLRRVLIVGAGRVGRRMAESFKQYPWMGLEVVGFLDDEQGKSEQVIGHTHALATTLDCFEAEGKPIDYVYLALPISASEKIATLVDEMSTRLVHVCLVPDLFQFNVLNSRITEVDGLPVIHLVDEAPVEFRRFLKRFFDVAFSALFLIFISPVFLVIAIAVKLSSPGPVFYRQERMGLNGVTFKMLKFRSMPVNAEAGSGPVWAKPGENRATKVGAFLRKTSLDELPQFINVLKGEMAVVGPRPERPVFIEQFKGQVPRYMLRHKMKAGITGWAQVNGWRGSTSIEKRIEYDIYYIQNWSLLLDLKIMWLTLFRGFTNEHAY